MGEVSLPFLYDFLFFLFFPFVGGYLAKKYRMPTIAGYIVGGLFLAIFMSGRLSGAFLSHFASFGIILLIFTVGLEVNLTYIRRFGRLVVVGGFLQIFISAGLIFFLSTFFGIPVSESILVGFALSLSSTAVCAKIIQDRGEESSFLGALVISLLVFQDLFAVPLIIVTSSFGLESTAFEVIKNVAGALAKSAFVMASIFFLGKNFVPPVFDKISKKSRELLNLFTIFFIIFIIYVSSLLGLSPAVAAFVAGVLVGGTIQHYHIFSQIRPFRDLFAILFFVFLGASLNIHTLAAKLPQIIIFTAALIFIKFAVVFFIYINSKFHSRSAFSMGIFLSNIGEFAFIILTLGFSHKVISADTYYFVTPSVLLSIALSPILISQKDHIYALLRKFIKNHLRFLEDYINYKIDRDQSPLDSLKLKDHVVICGYGTVGSYIGRALSMADIPFIAIDYNFYTVEKAKQHGINIIYGDPTDIDILDYAQVDEATDLILAVPEKFSQETIILNAKKLNPKIKIISRITREGDQRRMKDLGAEIVVQPEFEAALSIIKRILVSFNLSNEEISEKVKRLKIVHGMV